jgi:hypothetical protein
MDTYHMDERQKEYINLAHDEVLAKKRLLIANMNTPMVGMFGGGMGGMPMYGGVMGGMAGMGGPSYGGVSRGTMGASLSGVYGSMGAPPGGFVASLDPTIPPSTQDVDEEETK